MKHLSTNRFSYYLSTRERKCSCYDNGNIMYISLRVSPFSWPVRLLLWKWWTLDELVLLLGKLFLYFTDRICPTRIFLRFMTWNYKSVIRLSGYYKMNTRQHVSGEKIWKKSQKTDGNVVFLFASPHAFIFVARILNCMLCNKGECISTKQVRKLGLEWLWELACFLLPFLMQI